MTEVLRKGRRRKHLNFYGGGLLETDLEHYRTPVDDYKAVGAGLAGSLQLRALRNKDLQIRNMTSYFPAGTWPESWFPAETLFENRSSLEEFDNRWTYGDVRDYMLYSQYAVDYAPWDVSEWLAHRTGQIGPKETPEHFDLSPLAERRATGKVRKYYEPASFLFVEDDEVSAEDTEH